MLINDATSLSNGGGSGILWRQYSTEALVNKKNIEEGKQNLELYTKSFMNVPLIINLLRFYFEIQLIVIQKW